MEIIEMLIAIFGVIAFSAAGSMIQHRTLGFSKQTFLCGVTIGIGVMVWIGMIPAYMIVIIGLTVAAMLFSDSESESIDE
jgi:hypothetical protein